MTNPGPFLLVVNDGRQDQLIFSRDILLSSLEDASNEQGGNEIGENSTLQDVVKTHLLFTYATYKPHVNMASEYRKETLPGTHSLGNTFYFDLTYFGDLFADCVLQITVNADKVFSFTEPTEPSEMPMIRWCDFPGERLLQKVMIEINGTELDSYDPNWIVMKRQFEMRPNKKNAYYKLIGQEVPEVGYVSRQNIANNVDGAMSNRIQVNVCKGLQTPSVSQQTTVTFWCPLWFWFNTCLEQAFPSVSVPNCSRRVHFTTADATKMIGAIPTAMYRTRETLYSPDSEMYDAVSQAGTFNYSQMTIDSANLYVNNIFLNKEIHSIYISQISFTLIYLHRKQTETLTSSNYEFKLNQLQWPIASLYIGAKWSDYDDTNAQRSMRYLDRWHKFSLCTPRYQPIISSIRSPVVISSFSDTAVGDMTLTYSELPNQSYLTIAHSASTGLLLQLGSETIGSQLTVYWYDAASKKQIGFTFIVHAALTISASAYVIPIRGVPPNVTSDAAYVNGEGFIETSFNATDVGQSRALEVEHYDTASFIDSLKLTVHGIELFNWQQKWMHEYIPYVYGGDYLNMPDDVGLGIVNFAWKPNQYQPSGHLNLSRARETYLTVTSSYWGNTLPHDSNRSYQGDIIINSRCMNFLLISDGCASLRYQT